MWVLKAKAEYENHLSLLNDSELPPLYLTIESENPNSRPPRVTRPFDDLPTTNKETPVKKAIVSEKTPSQSVSSAAVDHQPPPAPLITKKKEALPKESEDLVAFNNEARAKIEESERFIQEANRLYEKAQLDQALMTYQKALRLNPDLADAYRQIGLIYMKKQEKERALRAFRIYLQLKPETSDKQLVETWIDSLK